MGFGTLSSSRNDKDSLVPEDSVWQLVHGGHPQKGTWSSLILSHKASEPSILESPGPEEPGKQSCRGGEGKDPLCCPSLLYWDEVCDLHPEVGWMEGKGSQEVVLVAGKS